jgi:hypothetical protein
MTTTYTWTIQQMDCVPQEDGLTDVVVTAHWTVSATDGTYNASSYGTASFTYDPESTFTPYADLTQEQVLGWVWDNGVDKDAVEANLDQQIEAQINPPIVTPPLPWATV